MRLEFLAGRRSAEQVGLVRPARTAIAEGEAAGAAFLEHVLGILAVAGGDHEAVFEIRQRHHLEHLLDLGAGEATVSGVGLVVHALARFWAHVDRYDYGRGGKEGGRVDRRGRREIKKK